MGACSVGFCDGHLGLGKSIIAKTMYIYKMNVASVMLYSAEFN